MRKKEHLVSAMIIAVLVLVWVRAVRWYEQVILEEERREVFTKLTPYGNALTSEINRRLLLIDGLKNFVLAHGLAHEEIEPNEFETLSSSIALTTPGIRVIHLSPGGVNRYVYPLQGNEGVLGHNLLNDPRSHVRDEVARALSTRKITVSDPYELHQGGMGIVARLAIYQNDTFWGLAVIILDMPPMLAMAGIDGQAPGLALALKDRKARTLFGPAEVFSADPVALPISLPDIGVWQLAAIPSNGWKQAIATHLRWFQVLSLLVVVMAAGAVLVVAQRQRWLARMVRERTRELEEELDRGKTKEQQLVESEARYRRLFLHNPQPMGVYDFYSLAFLAVNDAAVNHYGYSREEFLGMTIKDIHPTEELPRLLETLSNLAQGYSDSGTWRHLRKDGSIIEVEIVSHALPFDHRVARMVLANDVTARREAERDLHQAHQRLLAVMNSLEAFVYIADMQTYEILFINEHGKKVWGNIEGRLCWQSIQKGQTEPCSFCTNKFLVDKEGLPTGVYQWEFQNTLDGRWYDCRDKAIPWLDGRLVRLEIATDITERKTAIEEIKRQAAEMAVIHSVGRKINQTLSLRETTAAVIDGLLEAVRPDAVMVFLREEDTLVLLGIGPEEVVGRLGKIDQHHMGGCLCGLALRDKQAVYSLDIHQDVRCTFSECKRAGFQSFAALPLHSGDELLGVIGLASDAQRDFAVQNDFFESLAGIAAGGLHNALLYERINRDFQELQQAEQALRESEHLYRYLADSSISLIWTADTSKLCVSFNQPWLDFTGRSLRQELGNGWTEGVHPEDFERCLAIYSSHFDRRETFETEYRLRYHDGTYRWIIDYGLPRYSIDGSFIGYIGFCYDITERKQAEAEKEQLQAQLLQAQKMESIGRLAGGVAHDFNNMLSVILGYAELAKNALPAHDPLHQYVERIMDAGKRSATIARQLLAFARKQTIAPEVLNLNETVEGILKMLRRLIGEDIELVWNPGQGSPSVKMDPTQIDQILANLCVNARDAITGGGTISIETGNAAFLESYCHQHPGFLPGEFVLLAVSDNGCGMDAETAASIFEPFFTTKEVGKGTGLGLAMVYGIIKQNKGFIHVDTAPGLGTRMAVYIPRYAEVADGEVSADTEVERSIANGRETILLVEDETAILKMIDLMLQKLGYAVLTASSPEKALQVASSCPGRIDLLLTDVIMPRMNGRELARQLLRQYPDMKCLFMSGYTADVIAPHGVLDPGIDFIQKPFTANDLAAKIRTALL